MVPDTGSRVFQQAQRDAWNTRYRVKGRQWGNAPTDSIVPDDCGFVLELGIGDGKNLRCRSCSGTTYLGIDFSTEALRICRRDPALSGIELILADGCFLPVREGMISHIFAHHILGHLPDYLVDTFMDEMYRVLSPGGRLFLTVFAKGDMRDNTGYQVENSTFLRGDGIITRYYSEEMIHIMGRRFHFRDISRAEWPMRIRGKLYLRAELSAVLLKPE
jgi:ubiquinone/menaquinone biosynthesis C-methylase UbiE